MKRRIERVGCTTGRWPKYRLVVDGVDVGQVRRVLDPSCDRLAPRARWDAWEIPSRVLPTQAEAEDMLIKRAVRFGHLPLVPGGSKRRHRDVVVLERSVRGMLRK